MTLPEKVTIPPEVMARQVGDETVILDLVNGNYFGLDPVGTRVWQLLTEGLSPVDIAERLLDEYEITREQLMLDMDRLLGELAAQGLVRLGE